MTANRRFKWVALAMACAICAGGLLALPKSEEAATTDPGSASTVPFTVKQVRTFDLRPSLAAQHERITAPEPQLVDRHARFAFVHPDVDLLELPDAYGNETAASDGGWSAEVTALPDAAAIAGRRTAETEPGSAARRAPRMPTSLKQRLEQISPGALARLQPRFEAAKVAWPPAEIALVAIKDEKAIELHARAKDGAWTFVHRYRVFAASGRAGPKLARGDRQVPEGVYRISYLNPNSAYHVSMRVNYPNAFDREMAKKDGRRDLGGDIMIHGKNVSAGCLAVGDANAEELFVLAAQVGIGNVKLVIAPTDFRRNQAQTVALTGPSWTPQLYAEIAGAMAAYKGPPAAPSLLSLLGF